ncbi:hypothetical protein NC653_031309 [Populus alba x Populus x berolinensis]|nr:hypothetical protein NC653_031309 [Populus alba x Populus x berolinensis]
MHDVFFSFSGEHISNNFTHLYTALVQRGIIRGDTELEYLRVIESSLLRTSKSGAISYYICKRLCLSSLLVCRTFQDCWIHEIDEIGHCFSSFNSFL